MISSLSEFRARAARGNVVPVVAELIADSETPISAFEKLRDTRGCFLFESAEHNESLGRFSFLGFDPQLIFESRGKTITIREGECTKTRETTTDPLAELEEVMKRYRFAPGEERHHFAGGAIGYLGYDTVRHFETTVPLSPHAGLGLPEAMFVIARTLLVFDHRLRRLRVIANVFLASPNDNLESDYAEAVQRIEQILQRLAQPAQLPLLESADPETPVAARSNTTRAEFEAMVRAAKEHIAAGDIFQVVLSQRFETDFTGDPLDLYRALRFINPSPYMFCLNFGADFSLVGSSPELHVRATDGALEIRPIAGTRPRGATPAEDEEHATELLADPKERAEHVMLIDLARNDLGRVAEYGSVRVTEQMVIERYSHVMHIVSHVVGKLRADRNAFDAMRATFPAGTVSGAPKVRAMQLIAELEKAQRGFYAGAVGYFGFDGNLDSCIALRSVVLVRGKAYAQAGAGIVADSQPPAEYDETVNKAMAMMKAVARANQVKR
ncbi:MAG: anthranilate synthase component I [Chthoniobacterales bacterium]